MEDLDYHDIDDICRAARAYRLDSIKKDEIETGLGYFENNVPACTLTRSVPAACSSDPEPSRQAASPSSGQRLKLSGMHWTVAGAPSPLPAGQPLRRPDLSRKPQPDTSRPSSRIR